MMRREVVSWCSFRRLRGRGILNSLFKWEEESLPSPGLLCLKENCEGRCTVPGKETIIDHVPYLVVYRAEIENIGGRIWDVPE